MRLEERHVGDVLCLQESAIGLVEEVQLHAVLGMPLDAVLQRVALHHHRHHLGEHQQQRQLHEHDVVLRHAEGVVVGVGGGPGGGHGEQTARAGERLSAVGGGRRGRHPVHLVPEARNEGDAQRVDSAVPIGDRVGAAQVDAQQLGEVHLLQRLQRPAVDPGHQRRLAGGEQLAVDVDHVVEVVVGHVGRQDGGHQSAEEAPRRVRVTARAELGEDGLLVLDGLLVGVRLHKAFLQRRSAATHRKPTHHGQAVEPVIH